MSSFGFFLCFRVKFTVIFFSSVLYVLRVCSLTLRGFGFEGIANVRCHITRMTLWCNAKDARIGKFLAHLFHSAINVNCSPSLCLCV